MAARTLEEIEAMPSDVDFAKLAATTEDDIRRHMIEDGQDPDEELPPMELVVPAKVVREKVGMTQEEFADALWVPLKTLQDWENQKVVLDPAVRSLLAIVYQMPEVLNLLTRKAA